VKENDESVGNFFPAQISFKKIFLIFSQNCKKNVDKFYSSRKFHFNAVAFFILIFLTGRILPEGGENGKRDPVQ
jgi:hypothetical protein